MLKKIFFILIIFNLVSTFNLFAEQSGRDGAIEAMEEHIKQSKNKASNFSRGITHLKKAIKYQKKNKNKKAENFYNKAIDYFLAYNKEYGVYSDTLYYIGFSYENIDDIENATLFYQIALELEPKNININKQLANLYLKENKIALVNEILNELKDCNCKEYAEIKNKILN